MTVMIGRCEWSAENSSNFPQFDIMKHASDELTEMVHTEIRR